ncbi:universal stress protein [Myroides phaeus]|uniref:Nucleotide-binding universal stress protein, UspA family n=1 Tax=Myroides phaeus TaxID=702745 RepID=A0A1G8E4Q7_9FLAO|nr:universal stress protein [Myroides phaeus]MEC4115654.1 universal stress protein [Myroides phaeus]SDH64942.1 Nucleotide-binding universal stress protein, UspA family [Myroides phaeus]
MKKILVPTDFSSQAYNAIKIAAVLAKKSNSEILLLHVLDLPQQGSDSISKGSPIPEVMFFKNAAEHKLKELALSEIFNGVNVSTSLILERTSPGVVKTAETNDVDLIVMGSHGVSGAKEYFVGSNTQKVVRTSDIPVLVIKGDDEEFNINDIVFASDFSDNMKEPFKRILRLNSLLNANLHLLMVNTPNSFKPTHVAEEILNDFLQDTTDNSFDLSIYNDLNVEKGIINFSKKINADLITIATHGRTGLSHFFNGSISEDLVNHSKISVLTIKID